MEIKTLEELFIKQYTELEDKNTELENTLKEKEDILDVARQSIDQANQFLSVIREILVIDNLYEGVDHVTLKNSIYSNTDSELFNYLSQFLERTDDIVDSEGVSRETSEA